MEYHRKMLSVICGHMRDIWPHFSLELIFWARGDLLYTGANPPCFGRLEQPSELLQDFLVHEATVYWVACGGSWSRQFIVDLGPAWDAAREALEGKRPDERHTIPEKWGFEVLFEDDEGWDYTPAPLSAVWWPLTEVLKKTQPNGWVFPGRSIDGVVGTIREALERFPTLEWAPVGVWAPHSYWENWEIKKRQE
ncbi:MAG: hypothetical protein KatS3mg087_1636 [Patescibacteria group bacterium]|nr:MAG: hypothetical protein KatS3mg087_1636 [Patescibacteria group bacterium]